MEYKTGKAALSLFVICFFIINPVCIAQTPVNISDPEIELKDSIVHISYDILNSSGADRHIVRIEITDSEGTMIDAKAFAGDIGENISGGNNKHITWNIGADRILLNEDIYITIFASLIPQPEPISKVVSQDPVAEELHKENQAAKEPPKKDVVKEELTGKQFSRTGLIVQSIAIPGLGLSRMSGKPHWLRSVAGYGCIAGSLFFLNEANASKADLDLASSEAWQTYYRDVSAWQGDISNAFIAAAAAIWVSDFIWTLIGTSDLKKKQLLGEMKGVQIGAGFEPKSYTPTLSISYNF
ncbi:hypothetical protein ACFLTU_05545 [Bacteroidota bacterium]